MTKQQTKSTLQPILLQRKGKPLNPGAPMPLYNEPVGAFQGRALQVYLSEQEGRIAKSNIRFLNLAAAYSTSIEWEQVETTFGLIK